jgi:hypothetical protein
MSRYAYCHFCDDIRFEVGNKNSIIGIYGGDLIVEKLPTTILKLCIAGFFVTPASEPVKSISARVLLKDQILTEQAIPNEHLVAMQSALFKTDTLDEPLEKVSIGLNLTITPLIIEFQSIIKLVIVADEKEYVAGKLRLKSLEWSSAG